MALHPTLAQTITELTQTFDQIPAERKELLKQLSDFIKQKQEAGQTINLVFICTHNSRRSHMAQLWAQAAAANYNIANIKTYSGGTEATAFYPAAVQAMQELGFKIEKGAATTDTNLQTSTTTGVKSLIVQRTTTEVATDQLTILISTKIRKITVTVAASKTQDQELTSTAKI